jgi:aquaporin Z
MDRRFHWPEYLIEAGALACFMISGCAFGTLLGHPSSPVTGALASPVARRATMGVAMGLTLIAIVHSPWGRRSGAQMNPVLTLTFFRLGRSAPLDAAAYVAAQFIGGAAGVMIASAVLGQALAAPGVSYVVTEPGMLGVVVAFVSEVVISAIMMTMVLRTTSSDRWKRYTGLVAGFLVATFITVEAPLSGMSMNPARTVASALAAHHWMAVWVYFVAPLTGMLLAAETFVRSRSRVRIPCGKIMHAEPCLFCEHVAGRQMARASVAMSHRTERCDRECRARSGSNLSRNFAYSVPSASRSQCSRANDRPVTPCTCSTRNAVTLTRVEGVALSGRWLSRAELDSLAPERPTPPNCPTR